MYKYNNRIRTINVKTFTKGCFVNIRQSGKIVRNKRIKPLNIE